MHDVQPPVEAIGWKKSFLWLALAVACFQLAYTWLKFPAVGLCIFGYVLGLVQLTNQPSVRRAFYFGLVAGYLCYAAQLRLLPRGALPLDRWLVPICTGMTAVVTAMLLLYTLNEKRAQMKNKCRAKSAKVAKGK